MSLEHTPRCTMIEPNNCPCPAGCASHHRKSQLEKIRTWGGRSCNFHIVVAFRCLYSPGQDSNGIVRSFVRSFVHLKKIPHTLNYHPSQRAHLHLRPTAVTVTIPYHTVQQTSVSKYHPPSPKPAKENHITSINLAEISIKSHPNPPFRHL
jgi:hypothetical protein